MHFSTIVPVATLALTVSAKNVTSPPFSIIVRSDDDFIDGRQLTACYGDDEDVQTLCDVDNASEFQTRTAQGAKEPLEGYEPVTTLIYETPDGKWVAKTESNSIEISLQITDSSLQGPSDMRFAFNPSSNLATSLFEPTPAAPNQKLELAVEKETNQFVVLSYVDDTKDPPENREKPKVYRNWYECGAGDVPGSIPTIKWLLGENEDKPTNPGCTKVELERGKQI